VIQLLVLLTLVLILVLSLRGLAATGPKVLRQAGKRLAMWTTVGILIYLAATGRLAVVVAVAGALVAAAFRLAPLLVQLLPVLHRLWRQRVAATVPPGGQVDITTTETRYLRMELRQTTGEISGRVLQGAFAGRDLGSLSLPELARLRHECSGVDPDSVALIEAYLERLHGHDWQAKASASESRGAADTGRMSRDEAYEILGLATGATREAIIQAHRRLMQRVHPDRGGSDYLASQINRAKDTLLGA
jgi:hypothetical protein